MEFDEHAVEEWCQEAVAGVRDQLEHSPMWLCKDEKTWTKTKRAPSRTVLRRHWEN